LSSNSTLFALLEIFYYLYFSCLSWFSFYFDARISFRFFKASVTYKQVISIDLLLICFCNLQLFVCVDRPFSREKTPAFVHLGNQGQKKINIRKNKNKEQFPVPRKLESNKVQL